MSNLTTNTIIRSGAIVLIVTLVAHTMNYGFNILMTRFLVPNDYAALVTIVSLISIVGIPLRTATTVASKYTSFVLRGYKDYLNATLLLGIGVLSVYLFLIPALSVSLAIPWRAFLLIGPIILLAPSLSMNMGLLEGLRKVWLFSGIPAGEALMKLGCAIILTSAGYAFLGALGAISITIAISWLVSTGYILYAHRKAPHTELSSSHIPNEWKKSALVILLSSIAIALLGNMDIIAAKHFFSAEIAAQYSVLAVISRVVSYGSLMMIPILFPAMAQAVTTHNARLLFRKGTWIGTFVSVAILALLALYPTEIITLLPGSRYANIAPYLVYGGTATALWSLSQIFVSYFIAINTSRFLTPLTCITVLELVAMLIFHNSIQEILIILNSCQAILLAVFVWLLRTQEKQYG